LLIIEYFCACIAQVIATIGFCKLLTYPLSKFEYFDKTKFKVHILFLLSIIFESTLLAFLSIHLSIPILFLKSFFLLKLTFGFIFLLEYRSDIIKTVIKHKLLVLSFIFLLINASVPTSSYDCFTAHFQVAKLFLSAEAYPIRPDFQYLDALPLGIHMLFLTPLSFGLEGALNIIPAIFTIVLFHLLGKGYGKNIGGLSCLLFISMPEFIRVSMDPMVDTPSIYFATLGFIMLTRANINKLYYNFLIAALSWSFLMAIKPTMVCFPILFILLCFFTLVKKRITLINAFTIIISMFPGGIWIYKAWLIHGNPLFPYFYSSNFAPLISVELSQNTVSISMMFLNYLQTIFVDSRFFLSLGPWPLILIPAFLFRKKYSLKVLFAILIVISGLLLTFKFTSFKNRYFLPYLCISIPWFAYTLNQSNRIIKFIFYFWCAFNISMFLPYLSQPALAALKGMDKDAYYESKFDNYKIINSANKLAEGKILFVATPIYWLNKEHVLSIYSETYLDYTRLNSEGLLKKIEELKITYILFDKASLTGMINHPSKHYHKNAYIAQKCLDLINHIIHSSGSFDIIEESNGIVIAKKMK
jgi:hypothetical protein